MGAPNFSGRGEGARGAPFDSCEYVVRFRPIQSVRCPPFRPIQSFNQWGEGAVRFQCACMSGAYAGGGGGFEGVWTNPLLALNFFKQDIKNILSEKVSGI